MINLVIPIVLDFCWFLLSCQIISAEIIRSFSKLKLNLQILTCSAQRAFEGMPFKCFLCPRKAATLTDDATKCSGCNSYYHPSCARKAKPSFDGTFSACCGNGNADPRHSVDIPSDLSDLDELDNNSKILFKLLSKKIDDNFNNMVASVNNLKTKIIVVEQRLDILEKNALHKSENVVAEIQDRLSRAKNIIIYKLRDAANAEISDKQRVIEVLSQGDRQPSFNINDIIVSRIGNKFVNKVTRPVKVTLPSVEDVHWVFHDKRVLCGKSDIAISADLTRQQREYRSSVVDELKSRLEQGEEGLFMKYVRGVPTICVDKSVKKKNVPADSRE